MPAQPRRWVRPMVGRDRDEAHRVSTPLELLFDLTFVVAVAQAASELHHALAEGHVGSGIAGYAVVFFGVWWAWVNFTWFASAYDTDDVVYRLLTLLQMSGVLVFAAGIPAAFEEFDFLVVVIGYLIMRLAMVTQYLRAAWADPASRAATLRYAGGVGLVQLGWVGWLWLDGSASWVGYGVLVAAEMAVPAWAEFAGRATPWHPGHISERYGLFTIIVLGEVVAALATAVQSAVDESGPSASLLTAAVAGLVLVFALWWSYFHHRVTEHIRDSLPWTFVWAFAHYVVFASVAAFGAGLEVVVDVLSHHAEVGTTFAAFTVAIPVALFLVVLGLITARMSNQLTITGLVLLTGILVLAAAAAASVLTLPISIAAMALVVVLVLAYHLSAEHRAADRLSVLDEPESG